MRYYVHRNRQNQVTAVNNAFPRYHPRESADMRDEADTTALPEAHSDLAQHVSVTSTLPPLQSRIAPRYTPVQPTSSLDYDDWGVDHPQFKSKSRIMRISWSDAEYEWLHDWMLTNPNLSASQCLLAIGRSAEARAIFHRHHAQDSSRVDYALKKLREIDG